MQQEEENKTESRFFALVPAAGVGARMGLAVPKQYMDLCGRTMLSRTLEALARSPRIAGTMAGSAASGCRESARRCAAVEEAVPSL